MDKQSHPEAKAKVVIAQRAIEEWFPPAYRAITSPKPEQRSYCNQLSVLFAHWLFHRGGKKGVVLSGQSGQGKTALAVLLCKFAALQQKRSILIPCRELQLMLRGLPSEQQITAQDYVEASRDADIIFIDDIGSEKGTEAAENLVRHLIEINQTRECYLIATTNLDPAGFLKHLGDERDWSRQQTFEWITLKGLPDYRKTT